MNTHRQTTTKRFSTKGQTQANFTSNEIAHEIDRSATKPFNYKRIEINSPKDECIAEALVELNWRVIGHGFRHVLLEKVITY